ncbi:MAG: type II toxin-antitoxin system HipA family toxin [Planctomycetota bacterium]
MPRVHGKAVGVLEAFDDESQCFTFDQSYCDSLIDERPVLGQLFEDRFPASIYVSGPISWFTHLLPQGVMRQWRAKLLDLEEDDTFGLLEQLGDNMPGAVTLVPAESVLRHAEAPIAKVDTSNDKMLRFSLAGAQWKLSARSYGRGLTTGASGDGKSLIAKFHAPEFPNLPRCEYATMNWARLSGVNVAEYDLRKIDDFDAIPDELPPGNGEVYTVERFDRLNEKKIHIEDFGQILDRPPGTAQYQGSYEEIARVLRWLAPESGEEFLKLVAFCVVSGNGDAHLKNFSLMYPDTRNAVLTPAYDIVSTCLYYFPGHEKLALSLDGSKAFERITPDSFAGIARGLEMDVQSGIQLAVDTCRVAMEAWNDRDVKRHYTTEQVEKMSTHIDSLPLARTCS